MSIDESISADTGTRRPKSAASGSIEKQINQKGGFTEGVPLEEPEDEEFENELQMQNLENEQAEVEDVLKLPSQLSALSEEGIYNDEPVEIQ